MNIRCIFGHDLNLKAINANCTFYGTDHVHLSFYECARCGKRTATGNRLSHMAAEAYIDRWEKSGVLPDNSTLTHKAKLTVISGGKS
jgi:hypothetical protein